MRWNISKFATIPIHDHLMQILQTPVRIYKVAFAGARSSSVELQLMDAHIAAY